MKAETTKFCNDYRILQKTGVLTPGYVVEMSQREAAEKKLSTLSFSITQSIPECGRVEFVDKKNKDLDFSKMYYCE